MYCNKSLVTYNKDQILKYIHVGTSFCQVLTHMKSSNVVGHLKLLTFRWLPLSWSGLIWGHGLETGIFLCSCSSVGHAFLFDFFGSWWVSDRGCMRGSHSSFSTHSGREICNIWRNNLSKSLFQIAAPECSRKYIAGQCDFKSWIFPIWLSCSGVKRVSSFIWGIEFKNDEMLAWPSGFMIPTSGVCVAQDLKTFTYSFLYPDLIDSGKKRLHAPSSVSPWAHSWTKSKVNAIYDCLMTYLQNVTTTLWINEVANQEKKKTCVIAMHFQIAYILVCTYLNWNKWWHELTIRT